MSVYEEFTPVMALNPSREDWCIKVRVLRMWSVKSSVIPRNVTELHLILLDKQVKLVIS
jgi:hypothetical protein